MDYAVVIEKTDNGFAAHVPDLPGCVAAADTRGEVRKLIGQAIVLHAESLRQHGDPIPAPNPINHHDAGVGLAGERVENDS